MVRPACYGGAGCLAACQALYVGDCHFETDAYVTCLAHNTDASCTVGAACDGELAVYQRCVDPSIDCIEARCVSGDITCACRGDCGGVMLGQDGKIEDDLIECQCDSDLGFLGADVQTPLVFLRNSPHAA